MKLRYKETGKIVDFEIKQKDKMFPFQENTICFINDRPVSLKVLNECYEDVKEPLIKDEKIRKAVRAWADASGIEKVLSYGGTFWLGFRSTNTESVWKFECNYADASDFEDKEFSIAELCGEEEE